VEDFSLQLFVLLLLILATSNDRVIELFRNLGGRGPGGPQHPLPIASRREVSPKFRTDNERP
jgi:hypothetical protein